MQAAKKTQDVGSWLPDTFGAHGGGGGAGYTYGYAMETIINLGGSFAYTIPKCQGIFAWGGTCS